MIDHQLVLCRRLYRQIGRFLSLQYSIHIASSAIRMSALAPKAGHRGPQLRSRGFNPAFRSRKRIDPVSYDGNATTISIKLAATIAAPQLSKTAPAAA
jgi:hypothetical protein